MSTPSSRFTPLPTHSIQVAEATDARFVAVIPPGSAAGRRLAAFTTVWLLITVGVTGCLVAMFLSDAGNKDDKPPLWFVIPLLSVFLILGFGCAYAALRMCFTRTILAVEPHQMAMRLQFFGREKTSVIALNAQSSAQLEPAYHENNRPIFRITVAGDDGSLRFGLGLANEEKDWLIGAINHFLGVAQEPEIEAPDSDVEEGSESTDSLAGGVEAARSFSNMFYVTDAIVPPLDPSGLSPQSRVRCDEPQLGKYVVSYAILQSYRRMVFPILCVAVFELIWITIVLGLAFDAFQGKAKALQIAAVFPIFLLLVGSFPAVLLWSILKARVTVTLTADEITARAGTLAFGYERTIPTASVLHVGLGHPESASVSASEKLSFLNGPATVIWSSHTTLPVAATSDETFRSELAGVIQFCLQQLR